MECRSITSPNKFHDISNPSKDISKGAAKVLPIVFSMEISIYALSHMPLVIQRKLNPLSRKLPELNLNTLNSLYFFLFFNLRSNSFFSLFICHKFKKICKHNGI